MPMKAGEHESKVYYILEMRKAKKKTKTKQKTQVCDAKS
jgi:hypothetical protein